MKITLIINVNKPEDLDLLLKDLDITYYKEYTDLSEENKILQIKLDKIKTIM